MNECLRDFWAQKRCTLLPVELLECGTIGQYDNFPSIYFVWTTAHGDVGRVARTNVFVIFGPKKGIPCYRLSSSSAELSVSMRILRAYICFALARRNVGRVARANVFVVTRG